MVQTSILPEEAARFGALASDWWDAVTVEPALFEQAFGTDAALLAQRQVYLRERSGTPIGTASAWFGDGQGKGGYVEDKGYEWYAGI